MAKNFSQWRSLTIEHHQKIWQQQTLTLLQKNMLVQSAWTGPQPWLTSLHWLGHLPSLACPSGVSQHRLSTSHPDDNKLHPSGHRILIRTGPRAHKQGIITVLERRHHNRGPNTGSLAPRVRQRAKKKIVTKTFHKHLYNVWYMGFYHSAIKAIWCRQFFFLTCSTMATLPRWCYFFNFYIY